MLRGDVSASTVAREAMRRLRVSRERRHERAQLTQLNETPARLKQEFTRMSGSELLAHFRNRKSPNFFPGFAVQPETVELQKTLFPDETRQLIDQAEQIAGQHCWSLLGFGQKCFGIPEIDWNSDPLSGRHWPLQFHADLNIRHNDGSDARVVWELSRFGHFITLGRAYAVTKDAKLSNEFTSQLASWREQNPVARGVNWNCAMEAALRAMNLLGALALFLKAPEFDEDILKLMLMIFDQHGAHLRRNLEFSHIATSNHYLSDVVGLLWLGVMLPELKAADEWREFGLREMLNEMDKQVLADGADYEASTGYHRLKLDMFLYSFVLCYLNGIDIPEAYWARLRAMVDYVRAYLRPDGRAPLIGDSDSGQLLPIVRRAADDHGYVLALGAAVFQESRFKTPGAHLSEEVLWLLGPEGVRNYNLLAESASPQSQAFASAGIYILQHDDLYLLFNASDSGVKGRGSHGHNDALSVEVSACGVPFIVDPGTYVYAANRHERHLFRSTAYHSTVEIDGVEQNSTNEDTPFVIGNEARPRVLECTIGQSIERVTGEHYGYQRFPQPVTHRRGVVFNKTERSWLVIDELFGEGAHDISFRFHFGDKLAASFRKDGILEVCDDSTGGRLLIAELDAGAVFALEPRFTSQDYGAKQKSLCACWTQRTQMPLIKRWALVPLRVNESETAALDVISRWRSSGETADGR